MTRQASRWVKNISLTLVCALLGIIITWQFQSINKNEQIMSSENKRQEDLKTELLAEKKKVEQLQSKSGELQQKITEFEQLKFDSEGLKKKFDEELKVARMLAGMVDVKGKGIVVTVEPNGNFYVDDSNILDIVNELRASDAQAIAVNDERIAAMSEIRDAGTYVMVNSKRLSPPFTVRAIGDPDKMLAALKMTGGIYERLRDESQLKVRVEKSDSITLAKIRDDGTTLKTDMLSPVTK